MQSLISNLRLFLPALPTSSLRKKKPFQYPVDCSVTRPESLTVKKSAAKKSTAKKSAAKKSDEPMDAEQPSDDNDEQDE